MTRIVRWFLVALLALAAGYLVYRAIVLRIDYWDSYLYLNNARCMLGDSAARYQLDKPPVLPALYMPVVAYTREPATVAQYVVPHIMAVVLAALSMLAVFLLFRGRLPTVLALAGVLLCIFNRVFVHYANYCLADVVSLGFVAAACAAWFRAREQRRWGWFVLTGVLIGLAVGTRYQNALFPLGIAAAEVAIAIRNREIPDRRFLGFAVASVIGLVLWVALHKWTYDAIGREFSAKSLLDALSYAGAGAEREYERQEAWQYFRMLPIALSPIVLVLAVIGLGVAAFERHDRDFLFFFLLIFVAGPLFRVDHNEIRYLYGAFPMLVYFALRGLEPLARRQWFQSAIAGRRGAIVAAGGVVALLVALAPGLDQARRDQDPFFTSDVFRASSAWLLANRQDDAELLWYGRPHTLHPPNPMQFEDDEYFNIFHLHAHIIEYFTGERMKEEYWRGQAPEDVVRVAGESPVAMVYGTPDDLHAWEVTANDRPNDPVHVYASEVMVLQKTADGFAGPGVRLLGPPSGLRPDVALGEVLLSEVAPTPRRIGTVEIEPGRALPDVGDATSLRLVRVRTAAFGVPGFMTSPVAGDDDAARAERDR